jgi:hypothetical protein
MFPDFAHPHDQRKGEGGDVVRDADGMPIQYAEAILTRAQRERLQEKLKANAQNKTGNRNDVAPLFQVAFCGRCERPFHRQGVEKKNAKGEMIPYFYYRCASANDATVENLEALPNRPASWRYEGTGQTYDELWETLRDAEWGAMLREAGVKVLVARLSNDTPVAGLALPKDLEERVKVWAAAR